MFFTYTEKNNVIDITKMLFEVRMYLVYISAFQAQWLQQHNTIK